MSFLKKTGTGNPFASGSQQNTGGGGQPPRGYQGNNNNNHNNSGGGGRGFIGQQNQNKPSGGRGVGSGSSNPFASGKSSGGNQGSGNYGHQVSFEAQSHNPPGKQQQHQHNNHQFNQQSGGKSANPFASGGRGGGGNMGGSMEMDGSNSQFQQSQFGKQQFQQPRPQNNNNFNNKGGGSLNPFASASQQQGGGNPFANATAAPVHSAFGQHTGVSQGQVNNVFANPSGGMFNQQSHHQQTQHQPQPTQSFQQGWGHAFGQSTAAPQKNAFGGGGNPFFGGGGGGQQQQHNRQGQQFSAPSAPVRAEVNQQAINAVNMSAALAPSHVQELDLGLGLAPGSEQAAAPSSSMFSAGSSVAISAGTDGSLQHSSTSVSGGAANGAEDTAAQQVRDLIKSIATSALSEDPPQEEDVYKLMNMTSDCGLVAGRVPAVPPARRTPTAAGAVGFSKPQQINPFTSHAALGVAR